MRSNYEFGFGQSHEGAGVIIVYSGDVNHGYGVGPIGNGGLADGSGYSNGYSNRFDRGSGFYSTTDPDRSSGSSRKEGFRAL